MEISNKKYEAMKRRLNECNQSMDTVGLHAEVAQPIMEAYENEAIDLMRQMESYEVSSERR
jgi:hypothetical protein